MANEAKQAYPLTWPDGWRRIPSHQRKPGQFRSNDKAINVETACTRIKNELGRLNIKSDDTLISTNVPLRIDGVPRGDHRPADPGVAVYWRKDQNAPMRCMAIDRYTTVADNLAAVAATLEAMRAIERHGGAEILDRAFTGFTALPAKASKSWREVLNLGDGIVTPAAVESAFRFMAKKHHPDAGGDRAKFEEITQARADALAEIGGAA